MATEIYPGVFVPDTKKTDQYLKSRAYNYLSLYSDVRMQNWNTALSAAEKGYSEQMDAYRASLKANQEAEDRASRELKAVRDQIASVSRDYLRVDEKEAQLNEQGRQSAAQFNAGQTNAILKAKYYAEVGAAGREYSAKTAPVNTAYAPPSPPANVKADFDLWAGTQASDPKARGSSVATNFNSMAQNLDAAGRKALAEAMYARGSIYPEGSAEKNQFDRELMDATGDAGNVDWDAIGAGIKKAKGTRDLAIEQGVQLPAAPGAQGVKPPNYSFKDSQDRRLSYLYELGGWDAVRLYVPEGIKEEDFVRDMRLAQGEGRIGDIEDERAAIKNPMAPSADVIGTARQIYSDRYEYNPGLTRIQDRTSMLGDLYQRKLEEIAPVILNQKLSEQHLLPNEDNGTRQPEVAVARAAALREAQAAARQYVTDWASGGYRGAGEAPAPVGQTARPRVERTVATPPARSERELYGDTPDLMGLLGERLGRERAAPPMENVSLGSTLGATAARMAQPAPVVPVAAPVAPAPAPVVPAQSPLIERLPSEELRKAAIEAPAPTPLPNVESLRQPASTAANRDLIPGEGWGRQPVAKAPAPVVPGAASARSSGAIPTNETTGIPAAIASGKTFNVTVPGDEYSYRYDPKKDAFIISEGPTDIGYAYEKGTREYEMIASEGVIKDTQLKQKAELDESSEASRLANLLIGGQELASKPQKLRRLLANTQHGKLVQQLLDSNKEARNTATFLELRDQIYRAYKGKPEQVEKAIELLAASFILAAKPASQQ